MAREKPLTLDISLSVLEDLGENLYSSIPAVLSEAVANAWDADSHTVAVTIDRSNNSIEVRDDGIGMDRKAIQDRYLTVGFHRREKGSARTPEGRHVMGRKGIGKLSLFAIADTVEVTTRPDGGDATTFTLRASAIREAAKNEELYRVEDSTPVDPPEHGTVIRLRDMKVSPSSLTTPALRKRLARRFAVIGEQWEFAVSVDDVPVTVEDRDDLGHLQYLWVIGESDSDVVSAAKKAENVESLDGTIKPPAGFDVGEEVWQVKGWLGTFQDQKSLSIEEGDNQVAVLAWGKVVHEDLLTNVKASGYYARYLIGRLEADFLDLDSAADIATSDRQAVKETDPRVEVLREWFSGVLRQVAENWNMWRERGSLQSAMEEFPAIKAWHDGLRPDARRYAEQLFGKIGRLNKADPETKHELYRNAIVAFERLRLRDQIDQIENLPDAPDLALLTALFRGIDEIEEVEYHRIAEGRLAVVRKFEGLVDDDAREKVIQDHVFEHLWLLDPSWERATNTEYMEKTVRKAFDEVTRGLTDAEKRARIDIGYRTSAGKHVIVELKRSSVRPKITDLVGQLAKYREALEKVLQNAHPNSTSFEIEVIAILGQDPAGPPSDRETQRGLMVSIGARWTTYSSLFENAEKAYREYIEAHARASALNDLINGIG